MSGERWELNKNVHIYLSVYKQIIFLCICMCVKVEGILLKCGGGNEA